MQKYFVCKPSSGYAVIFNLKYLVRGDFCKLFYEKCSLYRNCRRDTFLVIEIHSNLGKNV